MKRIRVLQGEKREGGGARSVVAVAYANTRGGVLNARSVVVVAYANTRGGVLNSRSNTEGVFSMRG